MSDRKQVKAYAKINLGLDVVRRREDGYHEVRMIMQTVKLFDELTFQLLEEDVIRIKTNLGVIPVDDSNLIYKAIQLLKEQYGITKGMEVDLMKSIPVAAGMAGGSTDCAATLETASELFGLSLSQKELMELGVKLGADVPYCILKGTALSEGIGELLTTLPAMPDCYILVAKPPVSVSTKFVYESLDSKEIPYHPDIDGMVAAIKQGSLSGITERMENVLESVTIPAHPEIDKIKSCMKEMGAENALMSGSGPTVFGIFKDAQTAERAADAIREQELANQVFVVQPYNV